METGRRTARAGLVRAASTAARLANVVRRARFLSTESVVYPDRDRVIARQNASRGVVRQKSISGNCSALRSRDILPLSFHQRGGTSTDRRVVETRRARRIFTECFARRRPVTVEQRR